MDEGNPVVETLEVASLIGYLSKVCPLILGVEDQVFQSTVEVTVNKRVLEEFITDPRNSVLVVKKDTHETNGKGVVVTSYVN